MKISVHLEPVPRWTMNAQNQQGIYQLNEGKNSASKCPQMALKNNFFRSYDSIFNSSSNYLLRIITYQAVHGIFSGES